MATSRRVGNYAQSAAAVTRSGEQIFDAAMAAKPDFTMIAKEAIKGRSKERQAANRAEGRVAVAGINAKAKIRGYEIAADAKKDVADIKRPAQRMAGIVGALGTLGGAWALSESNKKSKAAADEREAADAARWQSLEQKLDSATETTKYEPYKTLDPMDTSQFVDVNTEPLDPNNPTKKNSGGGDSSPVKPMSISESSDSGISREGVYNYLTTHHKLSHNKAYGLMANIDRESSFRTVAPGDQGLSNGLFQWHKGRLTQMQKNVPNWQTNWKGQIDYALSEPGEASGQTYLNTTFETPEQAAEFWTRKWERPADPDHDVIKNNKFISTYNFGQV